MYSRAAVGTRRSLEWAAAEANLVAVGVAVDHLAHTVPVRLLCGRLDSSGRDALDPLIEVVDEERVLCMAGALGPLLDVEVPVLGKLPHRLRRVRKERRPAAQQALVPSQRALVVADREPREEVDRHVSTLNQRPRDLHAAKNERSTGPAEPDATGPAEPV